jgi:hypothetical protein
MECKCNFTQTDSAFVCLVNRLLCNTDSNMSDSNNRHSCDSFTCTECLRRNLPYFGRKVYRYNPKHLCQKLNGYGDNGQRKVWSSVASTHCTSQTTGLSVCPWLRTPIAVSSISTVLVAAAVQSAMLPQCVTYSAWNSKDNYDTACEFFVVPSNGFMSLTS